MMRVVSPTSMMPLVLGLLDSLATSCKPVMGVVIAYIDLYIGASGDEHTRQEYRVQVLVSGMVIYNDGRATSYYLPNIPGEMPPVYRKLHAPFNRGE